MVSMAGDFVYVKFSEINVNCYNSTFLLFLPSSVNDSVSFSFLSPCFFSSLRTK